MWISEIDLVCFKSYQKQEFYFPEPKEGRNIVLIGGLNGYGKTSILEALYLCLYGKDAMSHLARAGLQLDDARGYPSFLEKAFNGEAKREGAETMMVRVIVNRSKSKAIEITRKWYFRSNGAWIEDEATARDINRGVPQSPRTDGKNGFLLSELIDEFFVPAHIAPFFFFDGEEVKRLADQNRIEQVKAGLEGLLGVVLLRGLSDRLKSFERSRRETLDHVDIDRLTILEKQISEDEAELDQLRTHIAEVDDERGRIKDQFTSLLSRITAAGGGGGDTATYKEFVEDRERLRNESREIHQRMETILTSRLPIHLVPSAIVEAYAQQLREEQRWFQWEAEKRALEPKQKEFFLAYNNQAEPEVTPPLSGAQLKAIEIRINAAWESLFYPAPNDCANEIVHGYISEKDRENILESLATTSLGYKEIQDALKQEEDIHDKIGDITRRITRLEGIDRDGTLKALKDELKSVQSRNEELDALFYAEERRYIGLEAKLLRDKADFHRDQNRHLDSSPARAVINKSERVRKVIEQVIPELFPLKVKALASSMTSVYRKLAHKDQVSRINIENDGTAVVLGKSGKPLTFDRSAGENQIFATALIAGLAKVSGIKAPLVVDTPLGRLDSKHRKNILQYWISEKTRQVILLSQDEEIGKEFFRDIKDHVAKVYLLDHVDVGDGIGRTTGREDVYFSEIQA
ncbi:DNA sulfur modification protein DndD [Gluconobacter oxydans]|uniref:DNA sulfur modification protein DndD n=1 Tax=Gluconobacter oxydans TaxID=442 RepID=UPI0039E8DBBA